MIVLASASPRRRDMLRSAGVKFSVIPADVDESPLSGESALSLVERLAVKKARAVIDSSSIVVLAADTVVVLDDEILGKPVDMDDARRMIESLSGRRHLVMTGVCIYAPATGIVKSWVTTTHVEFNELTDAEVTQYLRNASPLDKAGAYAIQEHGDLLVKSVDGSYDNVVGLPLREVLEALNEF